MVASAWAGGSGRYRRHRGNGAQENWHRSRRWLAGLHQKVPKKGAIIVFRSERNEYQSWRRHAICINGDELFHANHVYISFNPQKASFR